MRTLAQMRLQDRQRDRFDSPVNRLKYLIRNPYAWPGGYPCYAVMSDGACLCVACCKKEFRQIAQSTKSNAHDGWRFEDLSINWEDTELYCDHCSEKIESAYGEG